MSGIPVSYQPPPSLSSPFSPPPSRAVHPANPATMNLVLGGSNQGSYSPNTTAWVVGAALLATGIGGGWYALSGMNTDKATKPAKTASLSVPPDIKQSTHGRIPPVGDPYILKYCVEPTQSVDSAELKRELPAKPNPDGTNDFDSVSDKALWTGISQGRFFIAYRNVGCILYDTIQGPEKPKAETYGKRSINVTSPQWATKPPVSPGTGLLAFLYGGVRLNAKVTARWEQIDLDTYFRVIQRRINHQNELSNRKVQQIVAHHLPFPMLKPLSYREGFTEDANKVERENLVPLLIGTNSTQAHLNRFA